LQELNAAEFDLDLTGFNPKEIDDLLALPDEEKANEAPPVPENPVSRPGDLWICGKHRLLCGDSTRAEDVGRLLGDRKPLLMVTDPPYGIELDSEWRDRAGSNRCGAAEPSYKKPDRRAHRDDDLGRHAGGLVRCIRTGAKPADRVRVAGFGVHARSPRRAGSDWVPVSAADHLGQGPHGPHPDALLVWSASIAR